jgi:photosystem II stability/assembly factor-like uncharacterized protein
MTKHRVVSLVATLLIVTCSAPPPTVPTLAPVASPPTASPAAVASPSTPSPRLVHISTITAVDTANAWVVTTQPTPAADAGLLRTQDGGATWRVVSTSLPELRDLQFVTRERGFAAVAEAGCTQAADCNTVIRSDDGGATWRRVYAAAGPIAWLQFVDATHGWIIVSGGALVRTTDGGNTWQPLGAAGPTSGRFVSPTRGWMVFRTSTETTTVAVLGGPWSIRATDDGGNSWAEQLALPRSAWPPLIASSGDKTLWILSSEPDTCNNSGCEGWLLWQTTDAGRTWSLIQRPTHKVGDPLWWATPLPAGARGLGFLGTPSFADERFGVIPVGTSGGEGVGGVLVTTDGGTTWLRRGDGELGRGSACGKLATGHCSVAVPDRSAWVVTGLADFNSLQRTSDAGTSWQQQLPDGLR